MKSYGRKPTTGSSSRRRHSRPVAGDIEGYQPVFVLVRKGRYSKTMAKRILDELGEPVDSTAGQADVYEDIADALEWRYADDVRTVLFYDEVINGSDGTLRQILHLQRDIDNWEPVLVFNGTAHMLEQIHAAIEPLSERIGDELTLAGLNLDGAAALVNKRLRYYCTESGWGDGAGCSHDTEAVEPFTPEAIDLLHQDVTPYLRHLRRQCNAVIEEAALKEQGVLAQDGDDWRTRADSIELTIRRDDSQLEVSHTIETLPGPSETSPEGILTRLGRRLNPFG